MQILPEIIALCVSLAATVYGACRILKKGIPLYLKLFVCASGCFSLGELWIFVNTYLGVAADSGQLTVRVLGLFGCLSFMLSADSSDFDSVVDGTKTFFCREKLLALLAPCILLILFFINFALRTPEKRAFAILAELIGILPAVPASYFSLKHLLLPNDELGLLKEVRPISILSLAFYVLAYLPFASDQVVMALVMFAIAAVCGREAKRWPTVI